MNTIENKELINSIHKLQTENKQMKQLSTITGFYDYYFSVLKNYKTKVQAFNIVNELYFKFFGETRYTNFLEFSKNLKTHYK